MTVVSPYPAKVPRIDIIRLMLQAVLNPNRWTVCKPPCFA
jgi:hypothetical protein